MKYLFNPMAGWSNAVQIGLVLAEAQAVIGMWILGMAGIWSVTGTENRRMVSEKNEALTKTYVNASRAMMRGASMEEIADAAIRPIRQKTRANHKRLSKRGLKRR